MGQIDITCFKGELIVGKQWIRETARSSKYISYLEIIKPFQYTGVL